VAPPIAPIVVAAYRDYTVTAHPFAIGIIGVWVIKRRADKYANALASPLVTITNGRQHQCNEDNRDDKADFQHRQPSPAYHSSYPSCRKKGAPQLSFFFRLCRSISSFYCRLSFPPACYNRSPSSFPYLPSFAYASFPSACPSVPATAATLLPPGPSDEK
jgi:hypothetical protein